MNLILRGGELYGSAPGDVYIPDGRIAAEAAPDATVVDVDGALITPGLIDIHTHVFIPAKTLGIPGDSVGSGRVCRPSSTPEAPVPATSTGSGRRSSTPNAPACSRG